MQFTKPVALFLQIGSYLPLALILFVQDLDPTVLFHRPCWPPAKGSGCVFPLLHPIAATGWVLFGSLCLAGALLVLRQTPKTRRVKVLETKHVPADIITYVIPYVAAFVGIDYGSPTKLLGFAVFFLLLLLMNYRAGQILMNPTLGIFGWRLYEIKYIHLQGSRHQMGRALARSEPAVDDTYDMGELQDLIVLHERDQEEGP